MVGVLTMQSLTLIARRWFDRKAGNTYHSVTVLIDGTEVHTSGMHYGYDRHFEQTALEWLLYSEKVPQSFRDKPLSLACREAGIAFTSNVSDVSRKRDL